MGIGLALRAPAPAAVAVLQAGQITQAAGDQAVDLLVVEDRVGASLLPLGGSLLRIADLLWVQVGSLGLRSFLFSLSLSVSDDS
jgi:hypothetical protein